MELKTNKAKIIVPYLAAFLAIGIIAIGAHLANTLSQIQHSRVKAYEMAVGFVEKAAEIAEEKKLSYEAMLQEVSASAEKAMEKKQQKMEKLQLLKLVNPWNEVPQGYEPELAEISDGQFVDTRCVEDLRIMLLDCFMAGGNPVVCSSYRTMEMQEYLFDNKIARLIGEGVYHEYAPEIAAQSVAVPGTSEHQLGLAVDIIDKYFTDLTAQQQYTYTQQWLMKNCWDYGFILRYPNGTTDITGIIFEPWHYRYVGREVSAEMKELGITFEEYLPLRRGR